MRCEALKGQALREYSSLIPGELFVKVNEDTCHVLGIRLFGEPCGACVWEEDLSGNTGRLLSIYVDPPCRRIGAGRKLLETVGKDMAENGIKELDFIFAVTGDRGMLVPFFEDTDVETQILGFPSGTQRLRDIIASLERKGLDMAKPNGKTIGELDRNEKNIVQTWLWENFSERSESFEGDYPPSFVSVEDGVVRAALLFSKEAGGVLGLDYVYEKDTKSLMGLINLAADTMSGLYPANTPVNIMLTNSRSVSLYTALFGKTGESLAVCSGKITV